MMLWNFFRHGACAALTLAILAGVALFAFGVLPFAPLAALIGALVFFGSEYTTHRFLFHAAPSRVSWILKLQHRLHYDHHIDPPTLELLFLPLWFVVPMALTYFGAFWLISHSTIVAASALLGTLCATLYYEWVHYVAHVPFTPLTPIGKYMKKYHLWHHFKNEHFWFGVSNPSMDFVGATYRDHEDVERSTTVREIWRGA
jgi:4-hydroxysphinganine ceramide fatty acyl 2-hydroxylase